MPSPGAGGGGTGATLSAVGAEGFAWAGDFGVEADGEVLAARGAGLLAVAARGVPAASAGEVFALSARGFLAAAARGALAARAGGFSPVPAAGFSLAPARGFSLVPAGGFSVRPPRGLFGGTCRLRAAGAGGFPAPVPDGFLAPGAGFDAPGFVAFGGAPGRFAAALVLAAGPAPDGRARRAPAAVAGLVPAAPLDFAGPT
jgi:hypothetical protein